ncbi:ABC transporter permease [Alicyclobacillus acidocaldarius]|uniref:Binding-protein-dependent transport systems inner membrane component n=1 Tax=Alicyclobacillus acidocaldarius (strain Tc-4-1) TaxID=1048834 RepID=F8IHR5_ALIAT|nr:ABC transporter permease subunit [Alicyclobacillus acidocaldarius]AEJ42032.1 binding-protein-dependent transport systems inner membrane component [Alicyclobacillus acidocaldarius subsp. acidocaldarius Tc-4-1]
MTSRISWIAAVGTLVLAAAAAVLCGYPVFHLALELPSAAGIASTLGPLWNSLWTSAVSSAIASLVGMAWAVMLSGAVRRGRAALHAISLLPLWTPPFIGAFALGDAYARAGLLDQLAHVHVSFLYGPWGVTAALAIHAAPIGYLSGLTAVAAMNVEPMWAARSCGAGLWRAFWAAFRPVALRPLVAACALSFAFSLGDFGVPYELGEPSGFRTAATSIFANLSTGGTQGFTAATWQAFELMAVGALAVTVSRAAIRFDPGLGTSAPGATPLPLFPKRVRAISLAAYGLHVATTSGLPLAALVLTALTRAYGLPPTPRNWDVAGLFSPLVSAWPALVHTVVLAVLAAAVIALLGLVAAEAVPASAVARAAHLALWLLYAAPGTAVAVGILVAFGHALYGTWWILGLAYVAKFYGLADAIVAARGNAPLEPWRAARSFGAGPAGAYGAAIWPAIRPAVRQAALQALMSGLYEVTLASLLYGPNTETIAVAVLSASEGGDVRTVAVLAVWMTAASFALGLLALREPRGRRSQGLSQLRMAVPAAPLEEVKLG